MPAVNDGSKLFTWDSKQPMRKLKEQLVFPIDYSLYNRFYFKIKDKESVSSKRNSEQMAVVPITIQKPMLTSRLT